MATCKQGQSHQGKTDTFYMVVTGQNANRVVKPGWMPDWCLFVKAIPSDGSKLFTRVVWQAAIKNHTSMNKVDWREKRFAYRHKDLRKSWVWHGTNVGSLVPAKNREPCQCHLSAVKQFIFRWLGKVCSMDFSSKESSFGIWMLGANTVKGILSSDLWNGLWLLPDTLTPSLYGASCTKPKGAFELKKAKMKWNCSEHIQLWYLSWRIPRSTFDLVGPLSEKWFLQEATRAGKVQE